MGTLAIDIETASPDEEPPKGQYDETEYFELIAVALGFRRSTESSVESEVLFREGNWEQKHTADLLDRVIEWTENREIDRVLTYNGTGFDFIHLREWAATADDAGLTSGAEDYVTELDVKQIDLRYPSTKYNKDLMKPSHTFPKLERVCKARSISTTKTRYADYEIDGNFLQEFRGSEAVEGWHIGKFLGEKYIIGIASGLEETLTYRELKALLTDYAKEDIRPLFDLYDSFDDSDCRQVSSQD